MKRFVVGLFIVATTMLGCAQNHLNIPAENYAAKVKVLGIAPILIDADSDISHPQRELLIPLIAELNRRYEPQLLRKIQGTGNYFAVALLADEPRQLFSALTARREKRDDANVQYNKYFWKNDEIGAYVKKNRLDAVMVIVVSGLTKSTKLYSSNLLTSLETDFNFLTMTAQILAPDGTVLWEYPNFRGRLLTYLPLVNLQYPDFSESEANLSRTTLVRYKSIDGIRRALELKKNDWIFRETQESVIYGKLFDEITALLKHSANKQLKAGAAAAETPQPPADEAVKTGEKSGAAPAPATAQPAAVPAATAPTPAPAVEAPAAVPAAKTVVEPPADSSAPPSEIVPATGSTR